MILNVIEDLATGRIGLSEAIDSLRRQVAEDGISPQAMATVVRSEAAKCALDQHVVAELLSSLLNDTRLRASPRTETSETSAATRYRAPGGGSAHDAAPMTRLRPVDREEPVAAAQGAQSAVPRAAPEEVRAGSLIKGRFELNALVGRGGMGMVFSAVDRRKSEAHDPQPEVAVKILNSDFQQHPDAFVALQREASKAQSLAHPNIATVFDFDRDGDRIFITMELLRGQSLEEVIHAARNRGIDRKAALPIIRGIAEGLAYAHRKGIVHSDLKPANIFLLEDGTPKILDFGIARAVPTAGNSMPQDQFDAASLGAFTEAYATEEMVRGNDPAPADDIYALGIIVYELLAGKHPFAGNTAAAARAKQLTPAPIRGLLRREWHTLARALAYERARRPRDAAEFLRAFFGATRLRNSLIAATLLLALATGYLWYRNYQQTGPQIPFEELPAATQQQITADLAEGKKTWRFYEDQGIANALTDSVAFFAHAYELHPGDREAARGLERAANEMLKRARSDRQDLREIAQKLSDSSEYLKNYPPVKEALGR